MISQEKNIRYTSSLSVDSPEAGFVTKIGDKNMGSDEIREAALKYALLNATTHDGKAQSGPIMGRILGESPEMRTRVAEVSATVKEVVSEVNSWAPEAQRSMLQERWPELLERKKKEERKGLPPLENVERFKEVRTRFAPNPDGPLHLGSAEPIIFCDEYAKTYDGKFILRFEDTSPDVKAPILQMYDWIQEDLKWLGVKVDEVYMQSERLEIYYNNARKLINDGSAYVCTCKASVFKEYYTSKKACPCRDLPPEEHLKRWEMMLDGTYEKGDAVVRIKTDLEHPNPALRDWPALRIAVGDHPRMGSRYRVWPLYNFSCAIDDHAMEISHIIRGKEHEVNTHRQRYLYAHMGWEYPEIINVGRLGLEVGILSKSVIRRGLEEGLYKDWDDPRLGTLRALKRRGLQPKTIRELMIQVGPKPINSTLSWAQVAAFNRKNIEPTANRYYFVKNPVPLTVQGMNDVRVAVLPLHPDDPERGTRELTVKPEGGRASLIISDDDAKGAELSSVLRLMGLMNIEVTNVEPGGIEARFHSNGHEEARKLGASFIHWLPDRVGIPVEIVMPNASTVKGMAEPGCSTLKVDDMIQFERFGFVRVDNVDLFKVYFAHR